jgi:LysR family transcriptional regulator, positive regulator for ilvC
MDYEQLRLFLHLSRSLHFGRTSRECHVSPSALSRTIQRLEGEVGRPLFLRDRRSVELAPAGEALKTHAAETLARWQALRTRLEDATERLTGTLGIFASVTACQSFLPDALASFRQKHPDIHIRLETGYATDALGMLSRGAVDVAVAALPLRTPPGLVSRTLLVTPLVFVAPASECEVSRLVEERTIAWDKVPVVLPTIGAGRVSAERFFRRRRLKPLIYGEVPGNEAILSLVSLGCGVGVVPKVVMEKSPLRPAVRGLDVDAELGDLSVGVCAEKGKLRHAIVRAFFASLEQGAES